MTALRDYVLRVREAIALLPAPPPQPPAETPSESTADDLE
jgi:hypothetical protein